MIYFGLLSTTAVAYSKQHWSNQNEVAKSEKLFGKGLTAKPEWQTLQSRKSANKVGTAFAK